MIEKIAIQTDTKPGYITEILSYQREGAYRYCRELKDAILFSTVDEALRWLERTSFYNGQNGGSFSGSPRLVRVEVVEQVATYTAVGPVE